MTLSDIISCGALGLVALLTLIQIAPIKLDPWSWIGKAFNKDIAEKVQSIDNRVKRLEGTVEEQAAIQARARILRFEEEIRRHIDHTKDNFDSVLNDCRNYERYCQAHPEFQNGVTEPAINHIRRNYEERLERNDFL